MKILSGIVIVVLFMGSIMPNMNFLELAKVPHLIEHYITHNNKTQGELSFFDFIEMHYGERKKDHKDEHQDKGCLPLQQSIAQSGVVFVCASEVNLSTHKFIAEENAVCKYLPPSSTASPKPMWHPPKV